jgi:sugar lactone lactonase YvrE
VVAPDDRLIVADRENSRLQFFTLDGKYLAAWDHVQRPAALAVDHNGRIFVGESFDGPPYPSRHFVGKDFVNGRVSVYEPNGTLLAFVEGAVDSLAPGRFISAHGIAVDSEGAIYTAENSWHTAHALNFTHRDDAAAPVQKWVPKCR